MKWNFKELDEYKKTIEGKNIRSAAGEPFTVSLTELMQVKNNEQPTQVQAHLKFARASQI